MEKKAGYVLGLDIGVASVGWAAAERGPDGQPIRLLGLGSHLFEPGTEGTNSDIEQGKDTPRNQARRTARLMRRQVWRRARRKRKLLRALIEHGLLPEIASPLKRPLDIDEYLKTLDYGPADGRGRRKGGLAAKWLAGRPHVDRLRLPYLIRAAAAVGKVEAHEFGRALYHLAQRRGFLSNRRAEAGKKDEDAGVVKEAIAELQPKIDGHTPPTLGAYLASLDPEEEKVRRQWTSREMYWNEFVTIWATQSTHHALTLDGMKDIWSAIFFQRPLREPKSLVGRCTLEPKEARLRLAHRLYQRFRLLQTVNNLRLTLPNGVKDKLSSDQRNKLIGKLLVVEKLSWDRVRTLLKPLDPGTTFSHERVVVAKQSAHRSTEPMTKGLRVKTKGTADELRKRLSKVVKVIQVEGHSDDPRPLSADERDRLFRAWIDNPSISVGEVRSLLGLCDDVTLVVVKRSSKELDGHKTDARLRKALGKQFTDLDDKAKARLVRDVCSGKGDSELRVQFTASVAAEGWAFDAKQAEALLKVSLERTRGLLSLKAIKRLLPHLEAGLTYPEALEKEYRRRPGADLEFSELPPLACFGGHDDDHPCHSKVCGARALVAPGLRSIRNPTVQRALTEVRKVVNAIVRKYGKPARIRVELARDLKNPRKRRKEIYEQQDRRRLDRRWAKERIVESYSQHGLAEKDISEEDIDKVLLADECRWHCPYTEKGIGWSDLLGRHPQFHIEHIWPRSKCLDNSWVNKTLCYGMENIHKKRGKTPFEAYGDDPRWDVIISSVRRFKADDWTRREKVRRFEAQSIDTDFLPRHLSDTRFIARATADYLGLLYGGRVEGPEDGSKLGTRRIETSSGRLTHWLGRIWGLYGLLPPSETPVRPGEKPRDDHRHHALDALIVAITNSRVVQALSEAAAESERLHLSRALRDFRGEPWADFLDTVREKFDAIRVSYSPNHKVRGEIHKAWLYSRMGDGQFRTRKAIDKLSVAEIVENRIIDPRIQRKVSEVLRARGITDPGKKDGKRIGQILAAATIELVSKDGSKHAVVRRVRIQSKEKPKRIGNGEYEKYAPTRNNHHTVVYEFKDTTGITRWGRRLVTVRDAYGRVVAQQAAYRSGRCGDKRCGGFCPTCKEIRGEAIRAHPVIETKLGAGKKFKFSLGKGDYLEMDDPKGSEKGVLWRVLGIDKKEIKVIRPHDNRLSAISGNNRTRITGDGDRLRELNARKVRVTYLGEVVNAGG